MAEKMSENTCRTEATLWKEIRQYLEHKVKEDTPQPPFAVCPICRLNELDILGIPPSPSSSGSDGNLAQGAILYTRCRADQRAITCPMCRLGMKFEGRDCAHVGAPFPIPTSRSAEDQRNSNSIISEFLQRLSPTISERGTKPPRCNRCRSAKADLLGAVVGPQIEQRREEMVSSGQFFQAEVIFMQNANFARLISIFVRETSNSTWGEADDG
ncbi:uncharacterized protein B0T15DRAFT_491951 [Chaetomium strumarium]|uniref:Uncharacterized protein n=1 Tax=Chaetomium strumarium TaxID=1170767 RepID=A0AAJ0GUG4_9PEZI|nr:hypothetical protein B0T15DRAFT_491951 [Chaetomium strumarium]